MVRLVNFNLGAGRPRLAQLTTAPYHVVVTDPRGAPFKGAQVTIQGLAMPQTTDDAGRATFPSVTTGQVTASVQVGDLKLSASGSSESTLFVTVPICADGPILSKTEVLALLAGSAMTGAGFYFDKGLLKTIGEIFVGGAIWTVIYRHSCRW